MSETTGRRQRNMADKRTRIFVAASALFDERRFEDVTTLEVSERADVAAGTLFRYAATKRELLLMVFNERFEQALAAGTRAAADIADPVAAVEALIAPVIASSLAHPHNSAIYERELVFGDPADEHRAAGLQLVEHLEDTIARHLSRGMAASDDVTELAAHRAARSIFAVLNLRLMRPYTELVSAPRAHEDLHHQIRQIYAGFLETTPTPSTARN